MKEKKQANEKQDNNDSGNRTNNRKGKGDSQRGGRHHNRRHGDRGGRPQGPSVFNKGEMMSLAFFDEGRNGQVEMVAKDGKTPIFPGSLQFQPVSGQVYDCSVMFPEHGRFGKALPAVPSMWIGNGWLTDEELRTKLRQELHFRWQEKSGKRKLVSRFEGWMVFMDSRDARDKSEGRYLVQLQEQGSSLLARCLLGNTVRQERSGKSSGTTLADLAGAEAIAKLDRLIPTVRRKFAAAAPGATKLTDKDIQVRVINVYETLRIAEDASRREIEAAFSKRKAEIDPETVLRQLGKAATLNVRANCEFALEALVECCEKALALLERRQAELGAISAKPTSGAKLAKAALKAAQGQTPVPESEVKTEADDDHWDGDVGKLLLEAVEEAFAEPHDFTGLDTKAVVACYEGHEFTAEQVEKAAIVVKVHDAEVCIRPTAQLFKRFGESKGATLQDRKVCKVAEEFGPAIPVLAGLLSASMRARLGIFHARSVSSKANHRKSRRGRSGQTPNQVSQ